MALLLKAEEIKGLVSIGEAIDAVEQGFRDQANHPRFSLPRQRMMAGNRRINIHSGGCVGLSVAGTFIHYERHNYTQEDQTYAAAGKRRRLHQYSKQLNPPNPSRNADGGAGTVTVVA